MKKAQNSIAIILLCTVSASMYGIIHDQFTVQICPEYFTVFHPPIFGHQSLTMLAVLWGTIATWWIGAFLGTLLAIASCWGNAPLRTAKSLVRPLLTLLIIMGASATIFGIIGYLVTMQGTVPLAKEYASLLPPAKYATFVADAYAHNASYLVGLFGGCLIVVNVWKSRRK